MVLLVLALLSSAAVTAVAAASAHMELSDWHRRLTGWPHLNSTAPLMPLYRRIGWLHMPKSGTSFGTSLAHLANASLPSDAAIGVHTSLDPRMYSIQEIDFILRYPYDQWFRGTFWTKPSTNFGNHDALWDRSGWSPNYVGRIFSMFREPSSRARSAYNHFSHSCHSNFSSFEAQMRGTAVTMVTGQRTYGLDCIGCEFNCKPLIPDVKRAVDRLDTFAFVGLVEEWALSICLLHTMHGPTFHSERCNAAEFGNSRKASYKKTSKEDIFALSANDPADEALYAAAKRRFWSDVQWYSVTAASCRQRNCTTD